MKLLLSKNNLTLVLIVGIFIVISCACPKNRQIENTSAPISKTEKEIIARTEFAQKEDDNCVFAHVSFFANGETKEVLQISVVDEVSQYSEKNVIEMLVSERMKREAKALGFKVIKIEGGSRSLLKENTLNETILLH